MQTSPFIIPVSLTAKSRDELSEAMLEKQLTLGMKLQFFDINFIKGEWVAWYEVDLEDKFKGSTDGED